MANKRIVDLDTQGEIDIDNLKFVLDSVGDGTKSITFKRVLDFATKQAETKQAEANIGKIVTWQGLPINIAFVGSTGVFKLGRQFWSLAFGNTIVDGVNLYPKYVEFLNGAENANLKNSIIQGNNLVMPNYFGRYFESGGKDTWGELRDQSLPALKTGKFLTRRHENPGALSVPLIENVEGIAEIKEFGDDSNIISYIAKEDVSVAPYKRDVVSIKPDYDIGIAKGDVKPKHVSVFYAICIGVDYD